MCEGVEKEDEECVPSDRSIESKLSSAPISFCVQQKRGCCYKVVLNPQPTIRGNR